MSILDRSWDMHIVRYSIRISTGMGCDVAWVKMEGIILQYLHTVLHLYQLWSHCYSLRPNTLLTLLHPCS